MLDFDSEYDPVVRAKLKDLVIDFCAALDALSHPEESADFFSEDGLLDLTELDAPLMRGRPEIAAFFGEAFDSTSHQAHYLSNFRFRRRSSNEYHITNLVNSIVINKNGNMINICGRYNIDVIEVHGLLKFSNFKEDIIIPIGES